MQVTTTLPYSYIYTDRIYKKDRLLLQKTVQKIMPKSLNYENSWGYIIQATRYGGFKWFDQNNGSLIFFGRKSEDDPTLVIPTFFAKSEYLVNVIKKVQEELKTPQTILKNISVKDVPFLLPYGFRTYTEKEKWSTYALFDDQTYPQLVVNLNKLSKLRGNNYKNLRTTLNKKTNAIFRKYQNTDLNNVLELFILRDNKAKNYLNRTRGMYYVSHAMYPSADIDKFVILDKTTEKIIGFTATSDITSGNTALVASIFKPGITVESVWGIYQTLIFKYSKGSHFINLGGCETEGTYNFMRRTFQPFKEIQKTHMIYSPL